MNPKLDHIKQQISHAFNNYVPLEQMCHCIYYMEAPQTDKDELMAYLIMNKPIGYAQIFEPIEPGVLEGVSTTDFTYNDSEQPTPTIDDAIQSTNSDPDKKSCNLTVISMPQGQLRGE